MESESGDTQGIIDELHSLEIQGDQMEAKSGVTRSIFMNFIFCITNEIK